MDDTELDFLRRWAQQVDPPSHARRCAGVVTAELDAAHARVAALVSAGQYLADVLRAGSTGNHTASLLGALDRWEAARDAGRDGEAHPPGPRARPPQRNTDSGAVGG